MCVYVCAHAMYCHACEGQRTTCRSQFAPSTMWVPGWWQVPLSAVPSHSCCDKSFFEHLAAVAHACTPS